MSPVYFGSLFQSEQLLDLCHDQRVVIISDHHVAALYAQQLQGFLKENKIQSELITFPAGEQSKSRENKARIEDQLFELGCNRDTLLIALGGGVTTDLVGFIAATYCRGIPVVYMPTTLLAMVDAAIGGKTGINTSYGKNTLGTFAQPKAILINIDLLESLSAIDYLCGFAEIIKHAAILDIDYFQTLENNTAQLLAREQSCLQEVIQRSYEIKSSIVAEDCHEQNTRALLNFGHTIGHALESLSDYQIPHGYAVALGMLIEAKLSVIYGQLTMDEYLRLEALIHKMNLLDFKLPNFTLEDFQQTLRMDKKNKNSSVRCILLSSLGQARLPVQLSQEMINACYDELVSFAWFRRT